MMTFEQMMHYQKIKTRRKFMLRKNYFEGLIVELDLSNEAIRNSKIEKINKYLKEDNEKLIEKNALENDIQKLNNKYQKKIGNVNKKHDLIKDKNVLKVRKIDEKINKLNNSIISLTKFINKNEDNILRINQEKLQTVTKDLEENINLLEKHKDDKDKLKELQRSNYEMNRINALRILKENKDIQLSVTNLKMYFGGIKAINDLSFYVKKGEIFGLIGPNGAGKTTVFNCITQFYKPTSGNINFKNKEGNIVALTVLNTHDVINEGVARSFQNVELIWELTVLDNLMVAAHSLLVTNLFDHMLHTKKMRREEQILRTKGIKILSTLGILEYAYRSPYGLPYGVLKKIELARTLMTDPSMIILDEPAAGLNDVETKDLAITIKKINQDLGVTIFLVEHDMGLVMSICDTICAISFGKMLAIGTPKEIQNDPEVRKAYLGDDTDE